MECYIPVLAYICSLFIPFRVKFVRHGGYVFHKLLRRLYTVDRFVFKEDLEEAFKCVELGAPIIFIHYFLLY